MMMKVSELKAMSNEELILKVFRYGIVMSNEGGTKADDKSLQRIFNELSARGIIGDASEMYERTRK